MTCFPSACCFPDSTYMCNIFHILFAGDLVLAKSVAVGKTSMTQLLVLACTSCILHGHIVAVTKPSSPFPLCDVVKVPGLLPTFLHRCEIKSGSGLETRLEFYMYTAKFKSYLFVMSLVSIRRNSCSGLCLSAM